MKKSKWQDPHAQREADKYQNPIPSREFLLKHIGQLAKPITGESIANQLKLVSDENKEALRRRLRAMVRDFQLDEVAPNKYTLIDDSHLIEGSIQANREGFGFLIPHDGSDDLYLSSRQMQQVFHGDIVLARVVDIRRGRREGSIVRIVERSHDEVVGYLRKENKTAYIEPTNQRLTQNIIIPKLNNKHAKDGQVVVAKIIDYPTLRSPAVGKLVKIVGDHMAPGMEIKVSMLAYGLPHRWSKETNEELRAFSAHPSSEDKKNHVDLRHLPFVTIDGEDAKDFDDAVFCQTRWGGWNLFVAIADVSHYVRPNSELDQEAKRRGNSAYFPGEVIPMLPNRLSNGLCSLKPRVERLCLVCEMKISKTGKLSRYQFYPAVIKSQARLTYTEVDSFITGGKHPIHKMLHQELTNLYQLYKVLHQQRQAKGAINFETTEIKVEFDQARKIKRLVPVVRNDAHRLIEECMLRANIAAAKFLKKHKTPSLYRVHPGPKLDKIENLRAFLAELGLHFGGGAKPKPEDYSRVLNEVKGRADEHLVQIMLLRSMARASYSPENIGHFSLAFEEYTHFTSPIRRYPDLLVHRAIKSALNKNKKNKISKDELFEIGQHCSDTERRADEATRDTLKWLKCEYMLEKVGQDFNGIISSVVSFGIFVELTDIFVEGLVHLNDMRDDHYQFDFTHQRLQGQRSGRSYHLGDSVRIRVTRVALEERRIEFELLTGKTNKKNSANKQRRKPTKSQTNNPSKKSTGNQTVIATNKRKRSKPPKQSQRKTT